MKSCTYIYIFQEIWSREIRGVRVSKDIFQITRYSLSWTLVLSWIVSLYHIMLYPTRVILRSKNFTRFSAYLGIQWIWTNFIILKPFVKYCIVSLCNLAVHISQADLYEFFFNSSWRAKFIREIYRSASCEPTAKISRNCWRALSY